MKNSANYGGGKSGGLLGGLKTRSPPVNDASRRPIGEKYSSTDTGANRSEVGQVKPATLGPRTA